MPNKELLKQLEIEKQRRGITRGNAVAAPEPEIRDMLSSEHRYAWEYEMEAYRAQKKKIRWLTAGALCGVLSLVLEIGLHWGEIMNIAKLWTAK